MRREGFVAVATITLKKGAFFVTQSTAMASEEMRPSERALRQAVLAGNECAWQALYDDAFEPLHAYIAWRCGGRADWADDLVQETWMIAVRRLAYFDPAKGTFLQWLRGIAANLLRNHFRQRRPVTGQELPDRPTDFDKVIDDFRKAAKGINLIVNANYADKQMKFNVDISEPVALGAALQWFEDQTGFLFVIREYGIVAVPQSKVPPGAVGMVEYWRMGSPVDTSLQPGMKTVTLELHRDRAGGGIVRKNDLVDVYLESTITDSLGKKLTASALIASGVEVFDKLSRGEDKPLIFKLEVNPYRAALIEFAKYKGHLTLIPTGAISTKGKKGVPTISEDKEEEKRVFNFLGGEPITDRDLVGVFKLAPPTGPQPRSGGATFSEAQFQFAAPTRTVPAGGAPAPKNAPKQ
jgi:hypothetical protein